MNADFADQKTLDLIREIRVHLRLINKKQATRKERGEIPRLPTQP